MNNPAARKGERRCMAWPAQRWCVRCVLTSKAGKCKAFLDAIHGLVFYRAAGLPPGFDPATEGTGTVRSNQIRSFPGNPHIIIWAEPETFLASAMAI